MTRAQECIYSYIRKNFVMESISLVLIGRDKVKITDKNGDHMTPVSYTHLTLPTIA